MTTSALVVWLTFGWLGVPLLLARGLIAYRVLDALLHAIAFGEA